MISLNSNQLVGWLPLDVRRIPPEMRLVFAWYIFLAGPVMTSKLSFGGLLDVYGEMC